MPFAITPDIEFNAKNNVTLTSGRITSWIDKIGSTNEMTPDGTAANGPDTSQLSLDGTPVPRFTSTDYMDGATGYSRSLSNTATITQCLIRKENNGEFFGYLFDSDNAANRLASYYALGGNPLYQILYLRVGSDSISYSISDAGNDYIGQWIVVTFVYDPNGIEKIFINDTKVLEQEINAFSTTASGFTFGASAGGGTTQSDHYMAHLIEYKQNLTDQQISDSANEMLDQWNLLPAVVASGSVKFNDVAFSNGVVDFFSASQAAQGAITKVEQVPINSGVATMTVERDPTKDYFGLARGLTQDFTGTVTSVSGNVLTLPSDLSGTSIGGVNDDHYIFRATGGTGSGTEVTVLSRSGNDITVSDGSLFDATTTYTLGKFVRGVSRVFPKD